MQFRLGADIDAAGRVVQEQDFGFRSQPTTDDGLLLIAATERGDRHSHARRLDAQTLAPFALPAAAHRPAAKMPP